MNERAVILRTRHLRHSKVGRTNPAGVLMAVYLLRIRSLINNNLFPLSKFIAAILADNEPAGK